MSFNMASYQNVANTQKDVRETRQEAMKKAADNQAETQNFKVDEIQKFKNAAEKASKRFGLGRLGGMIGGIALSALVPGIGTALAMSLGALGGGAIGHREARGALNESNYFKRSKDNIKTTMTKGIIGDTIMAGLMGSQISGGIGKGLSGTAGEKLTTIGKTLMSPTEMGGVVSTKSLFDQVIGNDSTVEQDAQEGTMMGGL